MLKVQFPKGEHTAVTRQVCQWDRGRSLHLIGSFPGEAQVHFWQGGRDAALVCTPIRGEEDLRCPIPDELLQRPEPVTAYLYLTDGSRRRTEYVITIPVFARPGLGEVYTPGTADVVILDKTFRKNGTFYPAEDGANGYGPVRVAVEPKLQNKEITQNGTYGPGAGFDGLGQVKVNVEGKPDPVILEKTIMENGSYSPIDEGADGYGPVQVAVKPTLEERELTQNGTYTPAAGYDGFSQVKVNVEGSGPVRLLTPYYKSTTASAVVGNGLWGYVSTVDHNASMAMYHVEPGRQYMVYEGPNTTKRLRCVLFSKDPQTFTEETAGVKTFTDINEQVPPYTAVVFKNNASTYMVLYLGIDYESFEVTVLDVTDLYPEGKA